VRYAILILVATVVAAAPTPAGAKVRPAGATQKQCDKQHPHECQKLRARVRKLQAAVEWQKTERHRVTARMLARIRSPQPFVYSAKLAYLACRVFVPAGGYCPPANELVAQGSCESGLSLDDPNPASTASNWLQYLDGTWANNKGGQLGWYKLDPMAVAIVTEGIVRQQGWRQWSCQEQGREMGVSNGF
jgi:hypothetical protein